MRKTSKNIFMVAALAASIGAIGGISGCAPKGLGGVGSNPAAASTNRVDAADLSIGIESWSIGRGSWEVDTSHETGTSEGSLGDQQVLVAKILMTNNASVDAVISPIDELTAKQGENTLKFGALYDSKGNYRNPEAKTVKPGQTVEGLAIWNIDDLETPVKVTVKCGDRRCVTIVPAEDAE